MPNRTVEPPGQRFGPILRRADQAGVAVLLSVALVMIVAGLVLRYQRHGGLIEIDRAPPVPVDFQVDINRADWPELTLLPGIGEKLAQRIVDSRQRDGAYRQLEDLERVRGIGPKTIARLRPYILVRPPEPLALE